MISQKGFGGGEESRLGHTELEEPVELSGKKNVIYQLEYL